MDKIEKNIANYLHHHTLKVAAVVMVVFIALAAGEFYLYKNTMYLNKMISEGLMQLKEIRPKEYLKITSQAVMKNGRIFIEKKVGSTALEKEITMPDGTKLTTNGEIINKNGTKTKLSEGEAINLD